MNQHPIQGGVEILRVASCYRNRYKLRPGGLRLARMHTLPLPTARSDLFSGPHQRIGNSHLKLKNGGVDRTFQGLKTWLRHFLKGVHHDPQIHSRSFCSTFVPLMVLSWINVTGDNVLFQNWYLLVVETVQGTPTKQDLILFKISDQHSPLLPRPLYMGLPPGVPIISYQITSVFVKRTKQPGYVEQDTRLILKFPVQAKRNDKNRPYGTVSGTPL